MKRSILFSLFLLLIFVLISCGSKIEYPILSNPSVGLSSVENSEDKLLYFQVQINDYNMQQDTPYYVEFVIQNSYLEGLISANQVSIEEIIKSPLGVTTYYALKHYKVNDYLSAEEIQRFIENDEAIVIRLYERENIIYEEVVSNFNDNR